MDILTEFDELQEALKKVKLDEDENLIIVKQSDILAIIE